MVHRLILWARDNLVVALGLALMERVAPWMTRVAAWRVLVVALAAVLCTGVMVLGLTMLIVAVAL